MANKNKWILLGRPTNWSKEMLTGILCLYPLFLFSDFSLLPRVFEAVGGNLSPHRGTTGIATVSSLQSILLSFFDLEVLSVFLLSCPSVE